MQREPNGLFVYGTLMRGEVAHEMVRSAHTIVVARTTGRLYELAAGYPALVDVELDSTVVGELCVFDDIQAVLERLDAYEGFLPSAPGRSEYVRVLKRAVPIGAGGGKLAWCYVIPPEREATLRQNGARAWPPDRVWKPAKS